jgi:hypothetical protein
MLQVFHHLTIIIYTNTNTRSNERAADAAFPSQGEDIAEKCFALYFYLSCSTSIDKRRKLNSNQRSRFLDTAV